MEEKGKFTFIVHYDGASCVSQIYALTLQEAIEEWRGKELSFLKKLLNLSRYERDTIVKKTKITTPVLHEGLINTWNNNLGIISKNNPLCMTVVLSS